MLRLFQHLKPFKTLIIITLVLLVLRSLSDLYLPTITADIVNIGIVDGNTQYILQMGGLMTAIAAFGAISSILASYLISKTANGFSKVLRDEVFTKVESFSLHEFDQFGTASLITRTTNDITQMRMIMDFGLRMMVMAPIMSVGSVVMAFTKNPTLATIFIVIVPILAVVIFFIMRSGLPLFHAMQVRLDNLNLVLREGLIGIRVIRAFNRDHYERDRFQAVNQDYATTAVRVNRIMGALMPLVTLLMNVAIISIVWFGGIRIDLGYMQVGDLIAFIQYAMLVMSALIALTRVFIILPRASASASRINEVLNTDAKIIDAPELGQIEEKYGYVEFKDVSFSYPGAERPALNNISFAAGPGEVTAIIGGTGSGKSTLASLLLRFYDVDSGSILVDGLDIRKLGQEALRKKIGYVPQQAALFSGTILANIQYGKDNASAEEIEHATKTAQASEFISRMKDGFEAIISQAGKNVSGGQKQRLAIARALIRKPEIYVFDDCFSALDYTTDAKLRAALYQDTAQATVLIVSQRVSTVQNADRIIVLEAGKIIGMGTHAELSADNKVYQEIIASQLTEEEIA
ncbi:MAG: ABC transporter ATP-binding protein/permease [Firmicutes bacterium]|nr:ABC transporter ATP-binding protein/permease [Bacillota bacterium]